MTGTSFTGLQICFVRLPSRTHLYDCYSIANWETEFGTYRHRYRRKGTLRRSTPTLFSECVQKLGIPNAGKMNTSVAPQLCRSLGTTVRPATQAAESSAFYHSCQWDDNGSSRGNHPAAVATLAAQTGTSVLPVGEWESGMHEIEKGSWADSRRGKNPGVCLWPCRSLSSCRRHPALLRRETLVKLWMTTIPLRHRAADAGDLGSRRLLNGIQGAVAT